MKFYRKIRLYQKFKYYHDAVKDFIKSFPYLLLVYFNIHIAFRPQVGLGDILRQETYYMKF
jgi:hypothetical protein